MNFLKKYGVFRLLLLIPVIIFSQNITVNDQYTATQLVQDVLFNNTGCATISNVSITGGNFGNGENSYAYFNRNGSIFPFEDGIILSTGKALNAEGPNNNLISDDASNWGTDTDLENILFTSQTLNATILEFDFISKSTSVSFDYLFASEEYQEFSANTCVFSDVFAFLIKPQGGTYENIALVPNTNIPVSVTTVHAEVVGTNCQAENEQYFGSWNNSNAPINFNGQTTVLKAKKDDLIIDQIYHIKLVIADHQNFQYDSAVFLGGSSFTIGSDIEEDHLIATATALCGTETLDLDASAGTTSTYQWSKFNETTLIYDNIHTDPVLTITSTLGSGTYRVVVDLGNGCIYEDITIVEYDNIQHLNNDVLEICIDNDTMIGEFDLFNAFDVITSGNNTLVIENFYINLFDAIGDIDEIPNPSNYENLSQYQIIFVRVINPSGCVGFAEIALTVYQYPEVLADETVIYCTNTYPDTISLESGFVNGDAADYNFQWFLNDNEIICPTAQSETLSCVNSIGVYSVEVTNIDNLCSVIRNFNVVASSTAIYNQIFVTEDHFFPESLSVLVEVSGDGDYEFAIDIDPLTIDNDEHYQDSPIFNPITYGTHLIYIRDKNGCGITVKEIHLLKYPKFFTPNNDNVNDTWNINHRNAISVHFKTASNITIFNRYGKIMAVINPQGNGWNGNYKGEPVEQSTYWFSLSLIDFRGEVFTKNGRFSLER